MIEFWRGLISFFDSSFFIGIVTAIAAFVAFILYKRQRRDAKKDAAKIIIQEIRRAEQIIEDYKQNRNFVFTKKIIATNSWAKNLHFFVGDLENDEIDRVSNLYSTGEFLDCVIMDIYKLKFEKSREEIDDLLRRSQQPPLITIPPQAVPRPISQPPGQIIGMELTPYWQILLDQVVSKYEPIYYSRIIGKLKTISIKGRYKTK